MDYIKGLNDRQKEAVLHTEGPLLIMAGAGSGKTRVVTHKIAHLIDHKGVSPYEILAITFTNKAANEMKERVANLIAVDVDKMWMGTFHSICVRMLRRDIEKIGYDKNFSIYDRDDQKTLIKECMKELNLDKEMYKENGLLAKIGELKNTQVTPDEYINDNYGDFRERNIGEAYALYQKKLRFYNALDFDDLLIKGVELLKTSPQVLKRYQERFKHIFVDEYQDTNKVQYQFVKLLSGYHNNICVVGDSDQAIYSWRHADITNILEFEKDFPGAKVILLEQNYRSTEAILKVANQVIQKNTQRKHKNLWTDKNEGSSAVYTPLDYSEGEAFFVAKKIHHLMYKGYKLKDIAILYRTNVQSRPFEEAFMAEELPYKVIGGLKFYDRREVKDIIAYLKFIQNPNDNIALKRIINTPKRGIGKATIEKMEAYAEERNESLYSAVLDREKIDVLSSRAKNSISPFADSMNILMAKKELMGIKEFIKETMESTGYIADLEKEGTIEARTRIENIKDFLSVALIFEQKNPESTLEDFLASVSLLSDVDKTVEDDNVISMMTVHSAKGLEFPVVFLVGMEEGLFPISRAMDSLEELEEERRLCYVAVTRAEEQLFITSAKARTLYGRTDYTIPSSFLDEMGDTLEIDKSEEKKKEIAKDPLEVKRSMEYNKDNFIPKPIRKKTSDVPISVGTKVKHEKFGNGMIVSIEEVNDDKKVRIAFDGGGLKTLMLSMAPLTII
ncbi:DNA helicase PcrA [Gudongella sp. DL1XJH-153]|uniref:DNA helicase PcrA n=1 Tax=Gudongella sp. DL1XJH-153 TaxID=3409804 RepID=UPI003BB7CEF4